MTRANGIQGELGAPNANRVYRIMETYNSDSVKSILCILLAPVLPSRPSQPNSDISLLGNPYYSLINGDQSPYFP